MLVDSSDSDWLDKTQTDKPPKRHGTRQRKKKIYFTSTDEGEKTEEKGLSETTSSQRPATSDSSQNSQPVKRHGQHQDKEKIFSTSSNEEKEMEVGVSHITSHKKLPPSDTTGNHKRLQKRQGQHRVKETVFSSSSSEEKETKVGVSRSSSHTTLPPSDTTGNHRRLQKRQDQHQGKEKVCSTSSGEEQEMSTGPSHSTTPPTARSLFDTTGNHRRLQKRQGQHRGKEKLFLTSSDDEEKETKVGVSRISSHSTLPPSDNTRNHRRWQKRLSQQRGIDKGRFISSDEEEMKVRGSLSTSHSTLPPSAPTGHLWKSKVMAASTPKGDKTIPIITGREHFMREGQPSSSGIVGASTLLSLESTATGENISSAGRPIILSDSGGEDLSSSGIIGASTSQVNSKMVPGKMSVVLSDSEGEIERTMKRKRDDIFKGPRRTQSRNASSLTADSSSLSANEFSICGRVLESGVVNLVSSDSDVEFRDESLIKRQCAISKLTEVRHSVKRLSTLEAAEALKRKRDDTPKVELKTLSRRPIATDSAFQSTEESEIPGRDSNGSAKVDEVELSSDTDMEIIDVSSSKPPADKRLCTRSELTGDIIALEWKRDQAVRRLSLLETSARYFDEDHFPDRGVRLNKSLEQRRKEVEMIKNEISIVEGLLVEVSSDDAVEKKSAEVMVWGALPKAGVNLSEMGKRALRTHNTQSVVTMESLKSLQQSLETRPNEGDETADPCGLKVTLLPHQRRALTWLLWREKQKPAGGILADDMGLGKTLTMISLMLKSAEEKKTTGKGNSGSSTDSSPKRYCWGKTLVICPSSVMGQWEAEIKSKVTKGLLYSVLHHGPKRDAKPIRLAVYDVVITSYSIIQKDDKETGRGPLLLMKWDRIILDEAHTIRNSKSLTANAINKLRGKHRWCLTGTPIHNKESDFYSLLKFLRCKPFNDWLVWKRWVDNKDMAGIQRLTCITETILLRRTKDSIRDSSLQLKTKTVTVVEVTMDPEEKKVYEQVAHFSSTLLAQMIAEKAEKEQLLSSGIPTYNTKKLYALRDENPFKDHPELERLHRNMLAMGNVKSHDILVLILRLRQICCHASLATGIIEEEIDSIENKSDSVWEQLMNLSIKDDEKEGVPSSVTASKHILSMDNPVFKQDRLSSKVREVVRILKEVVMPRGDNMEKAVVVSQWPSLLQIINYFLKKEDIWSISLTGKVMVKDRQAIVEAFNNDMLGARVLLLSLTAGGTGLNLIGGNHLLLVDIHWNPQLEAQACDRIYRVGQKKEVFIYKFICTDTIEASIVKLQEEKLKLATTMLKGSQVASSHLTMNELKMLFNMH